MSAVKPETVVPKGHPHRQFQTHTDGQIFPVDTRIVPIADNHALEDRTFNATICEVEAVDQILGSTV